MDIASYIRTESARPFRWAETDCAATIDRWIQSATGISPLRTFGRVHRCEAEARAWLDEPGGFPVAVNRVMRAAGFRKTPDARLGDVGLIFHKQQLCLAIHAGRFWFSRNETGLIGAPLAACWKAWRIA
jgi:hypothetical protein